MKIAFFIFSIVIMAIAPLYGKAEENGTETPVAARGSMMFDEQSVYQINEAIKAHENNVPLEILLPNLFPSRHEPQRVESEPQREERIIPAEPVITQPLRPEDTPVFYLKSIMYFGPENWSIWVNNSRIASNDDMRYENLKIARVSDRQVIFVWEQPPLELISPGWQQGFIRIDENKYASKSRDIVVDTGSGNISFALQPNQSLVSLNMSITEGPFRFGAAADSVYISGTEYERRRQGDMGLQAEQHKNDEGEVMKRSLQHLEMLQSILSNMGK